MPLPDIVSKQKRSEMMSRIKSKNTAPEMKVRTALHARGYRYCLHCKGLPGKPDIVFKKYKAIIMVHGCFWHGHDCHLFKWPSTRPQFWQDKIRKNKLKDKETSEQLNALGFRILTVWECAIKGKTRLDFVELTNTIEDWLKHGKSSMHVRGNQC